MGWGPNTEADEKSAYNNASWGWAPTQRISKRNSTDNASWSGPNTENDFAFLLDSKSHLIFCVLI